jgi:hypothetical protein
VTPIGGVEEVEYDDDDEENRIYLYYFDSLEKYVIVQIHSCDSYLQTFRTTVL